MCRSCPHRHQNMIPTTSAGAMISDAVFIFLANVPVVAPATLEPESKNDVVAG